MVFITIRYGDGKEALANPDCDAMNLLEYIAFKCGWKKNNSDCDRFALDLCDTTGNLKGLYKMGLNNAKSQLPLKEIYVPVVVDQDEMNPRLFILNSKLLLAEDDLVALTIQGEWQQLVSKTRRESSIEKKLKTSMGQKKGSIQRQTGVNSPGSDRQSNVRSPTKRRK